MSDTILQLSDDGFESDVIKATGRFLWTFGQNGVVLVR
ncbi:hypothetical protein JCM19231_641 [Vibrio ishigakensis]|uniref:Uncharacterized protein n=1 Tax=Vibrio ishigakensis TaxID=1481914 RepID=A0A0B8NR98_9VIBR|nr:hypothetical protein JCM19231_641 [Vibrio ishigakensis]